VLDVNQLLDGQPPAVTLLLNGLRRATARGGSKDSGNDGGGDGGRDSG
jgi:hypothetical protein